MNFFKSTYTPGTVYPQNWYGQLDVAPPATVFFYDDVNGVCVGRMDSAIPEGVQSIQAITDDEAMDAVMSGLSSQPLEDDPNIWHGDRLSHRWDEPAPQSPATESEEV